MLSRKSLAPRLRAALAHVSAWVTESNLGRSRSRPTRVRGQIASDHGGSDQIIHCPNILNCIVAPPDTHLLKLIYLSELACKKITGGLCPYALLCSCMPFCAVKEILSAAPQSRSRTRECMSHWVQSWPLAQPAYTRSRTDRVWSRRIRSDHPLPEHTELHSGSTGYPFTEVNLPEWACVQKNYWRSVSVCTVV